MLEQSVNFISAPSGDAHCIAINGSHGPKQNAHVSWIESFHWEMAGAWAKYSAMCLLKNRRMKGENYEYPINRSS